jgi:hypothetical protein
MPFMLLSEQKYHQILIRLLVAPSGFARTPVSIVAPVAMRYVDSEDRDVRNLATAQLTNFARFFTFLAQKGVEPTDKSAERALRCAVQWRKTSFGSRSLAGEVAVARPLTVTRTCRMQNRKPLGCPATAIRSHRQAEPGTLLLKTAGTA